jgi:hypothetical protein
MSQQGCTEMTREETRAVLSIRNFPHKDQKKSSVEEVREATLSHRRVIHPTLRKIRSLLFYSCSDPVLKL